MASQQSDPAVLIPVETRLAVHAFVLFANSKPYLNQNVMMYFFDQTNTWWRIQVDVAQNRNFRGLIEQMDPAAGTTIPTLKQDAKKALSGAFMDATNVQTSVPIASNVQTSVPIATNVQTSVPIATNVQTSVPIATNVQTSVPRIEHQNYNQFIAFTLSETPEELKKKYKNRAFEPQELTQDGRIITAGTGTVQVYDRNTCVFGWITVGGNPPFPPLHEIFQYFDLLKIPRGIIRWFTRCTDINVWKQTASRDSN